MTRRVTATPLTPITAALRSKNMRNAEEIAARAVAKLMRELGYEEVKCARSPVSRSRYVTGWHPSDPSVRERVVRIADHYLPSGNDTHYLSVRIDEPLAEQLAALKEDLGI